MNTLNSSMSVAALSPVNHAQNQEFELSTEELDGVNGGLVVIAIIAILIGMLLPAVQKVR